MIVREPTLADAQALYDCILPYADISMQGKAVPINPVVVMESLCNVIQADNFVKQMVEVDGEVVGLAFGYYGNSWWTDPDCGVDFFYTSQKGVSRLLLQCMIDGFKARGCGWMYAGAESAVSDTNTRLYENLFKKHGFHDIGGGRMILNLRGD